MERVILVACSKAKLAAPAEARLLYQGDLFRKARSLAALRGARWFILSAKHGLVAPDTVLQPYDDTLAHATRERLAAWNALVLAQLGAARLLAEPLEVLAGRCYRGWTACLDVTVPMRGMGIGQQKAWLSKQLDSITNG
jgi:hypothetical protein